MFITNNILSKFKERKKERESFIFDLELRCGFSSTMYVWMQTIQPNQKPKPKKKTTTNISKTMMVWVVEKYIIHTCVSIALIIIIDALNFLHQPSAMLDVDDHQHHFFYYSSEREKNSFYIIFR